MTNKITAGTIARTIVLALALINQILTATGHSVISISDDTVNTLITTGFTVVAAVIAWWKNNSFTKNAITGDVVKNGLNNNEIYPYKLEKCIKENVKR